MIEAKMEKKRKNILGVLTSTLSQIFLSQLKAVLFGRVGVGSVPE